MKENQLDPIPIEPQDARLIEHIRIWLELNRLTRNQRDAKRTDKQEGEPKCQ